MYPRTNIDGKSQVSYVINPNMNATLDIPNTHVLFSDAEFGRCLTTRNSYYCTLILVLGVAVQMKVQKTVSPMTHTTDAELKANFDGCRNLIPVRSLFQYMGCPLSDPSNSYCDNRAVFSIVENERMTPRCRHFDIPIAFLQAHKNIVYKPILVPTDKMLADIGTKPNTPAVFKRLKYWITGARFLPPPDHLHFRLLQLQFYEQDFHVINQMIQKINE